LDGGTTLVASIYTVPSKSGELFFRADRPYAALTIKLMPRHRSKNLNFVEMTLRLLSFVGVLLLTWNCPFPSGNCVPGRLQRSK